MKENSLEYVSGRVVIVTSSNSYHTIRHLILLNPSGRNIQVPTTKLYLEYSNFQIFNVKYILFLSWIFLVESISRFN